MARFTTDLVAGMAGTLALTALHEGARRVLPAAPRMDVVGKEALARLRENVSPHASNKGPTYLETLATEILTNTAFYALGMRAVRHRPWAGGFAIGALTGVGALVLPRVLGLAAPPHSHLARNQIMTVAWYVAGALAATCTYQRLTSDDDERYREADSDAVFADVAKEASDESTSLS